MDPAGWVEIDIVGDLIGKERKLSIYSAGTKLHKSVCTEADLILQGGITDIKGTCSSMGCVGVELLDGRCPKSPGYLYTSCPDRSGGVVQSDSPRKNKVIPIPELIFVREKLIRLHLCPFLFEPDTRFQAEMPAQRELFIEITRQKISSGVRSKGFIPSNLDLSSVYTQPERSFQRAQSSVSQKKRAAQGLLIKRDFQILLHRVRTEPVDLDLFVEIVTVVEAKFGMIEKTVHFQS